jgi:hypothetical protein
MGLSPIPYMVGGDVEHPVEVMRAVAYMATRGASGVGTPDSFKPAATTVPSDRIVLSAGIAAADNAYPGGRNQSYVMFADSELEVPIEPTGSAGGRTDLVVLRILDPQYEGATPANPQTFQYARAYVVKGVAANTAGTRGLGLSFPAVAIARVTLPANTATVTPDMVTDVRRLVAPRSERRLKATVPGGTFELTASGKTRLTSWVPQFYVPEWATDVQVTATLTGAFVTGDTSGFLDVRMGTQQSSDLPYDFEAATATETSRHTLVVTGGFTVPSGWRETSQGVTLYGLRSANKTGKLALNRTQVLYDVEFYEEVR